MSQCALPRPTSSASRPSAGEDRYITATRAILEQARQHSKQGERFEFARTVGDSLDRAPSLLRLIHEARMRRSGKYALRWAKGGGSAARAAAKAKNFGRSESVDMPLHRAIINKAKEELLLQILRTYPAAAKTKGGNGLLPLHYAARYNASSKFVEELIKANPDALITKERDEETGKIPLQLAIENASSTELLLVLLLNDLPFYFDDSGKPQPKKDFLQALDDLPLTFGKSGKPQPKKDAYHAHSWTIILEESSKRRSKLPLERTKSIVQKVFAKHPTLNHLLAHAKDDADRVAINICHKEVKKVMTDFIFFFQRYEIQEKVHESATSIVCFFLDHFDASKPARRVALKFMREQDQFDKELDARLINNDTDKQKDSLEKKKTEQEAAIKSLEAAMKDQQARLEALTQNLHELLVGREQTIKDAQDGTEAHADIDIQQADELTSMLQPSVEYEAALQSRQELQELEAQLSDLHTLLDMTNDEYKSITLDRNMVLGVEKRFDGDRELNYYDELSRIGLFPHSQEPYRFCLVLEAADRSLRDIIDKDRTARKDLEVIKSIIRQLAKALKELHSKSIIHGDLKPPNVVRVESDIKLIDLDASAKFNTRAAQKFSSAYLPPELIAGEGGVYSVKGQARTKKEKEINTLKERIAARAKCITPHPAEERSDEELAAELQELEADFAKMADEFDQVYGYARATTSIDMWALGCILYHLCAGEALWLANADDNLDQYNLMMLSKWSDKIRNEKLKAKIANKNARNLCSQLLSTDPSKRPRSMQAVLKHPFLTGRSAGRLPGEKAEFDVFLSYRVDSDLQNVKILHDLLVRRGLKVWLDKECLTKGQNWEAAFCDGLTKSRCFVPILSRKAIKSRFEALTETSRCDNVLFEYRLAIELTDRGMLEANYPVMIGDEDEAKPGVYTNYFRTGCHPASPLVTVQAVEDKLVDHLDKQGLGSPLHDAMSVKQIVDAITVNQGGKIEGEGLEVLMETQAEKIHEMVMRLQSSDAEAALQDDYGHDSYSSATGSGYRASSSPKKKSSASSKSLEGATRTEGTSQLDAEELGLKLEAANETIRLLMQQLGEMK